VGVPVLLWANSGGPEINPGLSLPEDDAVLLARYQVARWHAHPVVFILNGDGRYSGEHAGRWHRIGRATFADKDEGVPVALHPAGQQWLGPDFKGEPWVDILGYQSGHGGTESAWRWLAGAGVEGAEGPAHGWHNAPGKIAMNLEPCYEDHHRMVAAREAARRQAGHHDLPPAEDILERFTAEDVRRALYWSLLVTPAAGVVYGGHGVWGWDEGTEPPIAHPLTGTPRHWSQALRLPGAEQVCHLRAAFESVAWWTLRPHPSLVREQPGDADVLRTVSAARSADGRLAVLYLPAGSRPVLDVSPLAPDLRATWINPRDGTRIPDASAELAGESAVRPAPPGDGDWLLVYAPTNAAAAGDRS
jgi:hypothetical protein